MPDKPPRLFLNSQLYLAFLVYVKCRSVVMHWERHKSMRRIHLHHFNIFKSINMLSNTKQNVNLNAIWSTCPRAHLPHAQGFTWPWPQSCQRAGLVIVSVGSVPDIDRYLELRWCSVGKTTKQRALKWPRCLKIIKLQSFESYSFTERLLHFLLNASRFNVWHES